MVQCYFQKKSKTENRPVKNSIKGTQGTTLFRNNIANSSLKNSVNGTEGIMLFSQEWGRLKITPSKIELAEHSLQCYFPKKEEN